MIYKLSGYGELKDIFKMVNRENAYTDEAFEAMFDYIDENYEEDYEIDPIVLCGVFDEYATIEAACKAYDNHDEIKGIMDKCEKENGYLWDYMEQIKEAFEEINITLIIANRNDHILLEC